MVSNTSNKCLIDMPDLWKYPEGKMKKLAVITAAFALSIALIGVQAQASSNIDIPRLLPKNVKIIHSDKFKNPYAFSHKKHRKNELKQNALPVLTGEQAKANTPFGIHSIKISAADIIPGTLNLSTSEALFKSNAYIYILKTRK
jgi:hypothetical protein